MLRILKTLFESVNARGVEYCHFKSNDHLEAGLDGLTDLDIVVSPFDANEFVKALLELDFKRTDAGFCVKNFSREALTCHLENLQD